MVRFILIIELFLDTSLGQVPASAMFATNARYKRESYRGSEFASKILDDNDIPVVMKVSKF